MYRFVVFTLAFTCVFGASLLKGPVPKLDGRIVGGVATTIEEFPHQVSLRYEGSHICGGSVYNETIIVTAAHCVYQRLVHPLSVVAGATRLSDEGVSVKVSQIYIHEDYIPYTIDNDIALLNIEKPLKFGDSIQPIPLENSDVEPGTPALVSGWGALREGGSLPDVLQYVEVAIVDSEVCGDAYDSINSITDAMLCAGDKNGGRDTCDADSGGPLIANGKLIGIVSWGYGCALPQYPGVYSKVSNLLKWVKSTLEN